MSAEETSLVEPSAMISGAVAKVSLGAFLFLIFMIGVWVAGVGFHDPDTCWLLALGRYIVQHGGLPSTDPFSYTFAMPPAKPFVMYQWLTEVLFYLSYLAGGLLTLICVIALVVYTSFVLVPLATMERLGLGRLRSFALIALALMTAGFHLLIRPEMFSYVMVSIWLSLLLRVRTLENEDARFHWKFIAICAAMMVLWANLHTGFTTALIMLGVYVVSQTVAWLLGIRRGDATREGAVQFAAQLPADLRRPDFPKTSAAILVASCLGTLINPYGTALWSYVGFLFSAPFNKFIDELKPLGLKDCLDPQWYPFFLMCIVSISLCFKRMRSAPRENLASAAALAVLIWIGFAHRRVVSFSSLFLLYECAWLSAHASAASQDGFITRVNARLKELFRIDAVWIVSSIALVLFGAITIATGPVKPSLPQGSKGFGYPAEVIEYMKLNPPHGHGFNSPQLGDAMIWHLSPCPSIFIDTRFDMHGASLVEDYREIAGCVPGWQSRFEKYNVDWVFIHTAEPLFKQLMASGDWKIVSQSTGAAYLVRNKERR